MESNLINKIKSISANDLNYSQEIDVKNSIKQLAANIRAEKQSKNPLKYLQIVDTGIFRKFLTGDANSRLISEIKNQEAISKKRTKKIQEIKPALDRFRSIKIQKEKLLTFEDLSFPVAENTNYKLQGKNLYSINYEVNCYEDWNYYSKSWHKEYGPRRTYERQLQIRYLLNGKISNVQSVFVDIKSSTQVQKTILDTLLEIEGTKNKGKMDLRIHKMIDLKQIEHFGRYQIWERSLFGNVIGYVAKFGGNTYHDSTIKKAIIGLTEKRRAFKKVLKGKKITYSLLRKDLRFCEEGTNDFYATLQLDQVETRETLIQKALKNAQKTISLCAKYPKEALKLSEFLEINVKQFGIQIPV